LLWVIVVASGLLVMTTSAIEIARDRDDLIQTKRNEAEAVVRANRDALSLALWSFDQRALSITAESLIRGTSIFRIEIVEPGKSEMTLVRLKQPAKVDYSWQVPLFRPKTNETIGFLRISENYADILTQVRRRAGALIIAEVVKILAVSIFLFFLIHRWITRPLSMLAHKVQDTATSETYERIDLNRPFHGGYDEIDALVSAINFNHHERARMEATQRLQQVREAQSGKLDALGRVASGVAHDFNNILGAILGFARLLVQDLARDSLQYHFAQRILAASDRGRQLVEEILAFTRGGGVERKVVDLQKIVRQSAALLSESFAKCADVKFFYFAQELPVLGNEAQLGQLVSNLCINANESLGGKPVTVRIQLSRVSRSDVQALMIAGMSAMERIFGDVAPASEFVRLSVSDSGAGIPPDILDRIFEPFYSTKGRHHGTGLGLAVVHGVVESHAGVCHVQTSPTGTCFSVYLPLAGVLSSILPKSDVDQKPPVGRERILIVDDEPDIVDALTLGLERLGYETVGVCDPIEALDAFAESPDAWDVVVTDQIMPGMRGLELIQKMKAIRANIRIVLCTGYSDGRDAVVSHEAGVDALHLKPVDANLIAHVVRELMDNPARV
jgi:signal transduction histidine kinase/ActR/RegA family two-component response regulator